MAEVIIAAVLIIVVYVGALVWSVKFRKKDELEDWSRG